MKVFFTDKKVKYEYNKACKIVIKKIINYLVLI